MGSEDTMCASLICDDEDINTNSSRNNSEDSKQEKQQQNKQNKSENKKKKLSNALRENLLRRKQNS